MEKFIQLTISGVSEGAVLALVALGFVLIYKSSDVINFAQGELLVVGGYVAFVLIVLLGIPWPIAILLTVAVAAAIGVLIEHLVLRPMIGEPVISVIMITIGLSVLLRAIMGILFGTAPVKLPQFIPNAPVTILGATVAEDRLWAIAIASVLVGALTLFFRQNRDGIAMRAVADDQQAALSMGISVKRIWAVAWAIAAMTAALGGMILASILGGVGGDIATIGLFVFPVVILGGLDSILGAVVGGVIIGLLRAYASGYLPPALAAGDILPFIVLVIILMLRPYGLFGQKIIERV